ncbi:MAG: AraC family transcriptional regulator [Lachnospiraceae bacterium]|nr:AraC family transcriptional regulator [Lachnospiraceae bacterium]
MKDYEKIRNNNLHQSISDLSFYSAGFQGCKPNHSYGPKFRSYQLIHFVLYGKGEFHINGHIFHLSKGDAFIIPAGKVCYYKADAKDPWCYIWINYSGINSQMYTYQLMNSIDDVFIIHDLDIDKYKYKIYELFKLNHNTISRYFKCNSILLDIMSMLFEDFNLDEKNLSHTSIADDVKHYLDINYPEKIKMKEIAKEFGIHPNYLTKIFHDKFDISPKNYLKKLKLEKAQSLLKTTDLPISTISDSLGFNDQLAFSRTFKKEFSVSPSEYRKNPIETPNI